MESLYLTKVDIQKSSVFFEIFDCLDRHTVIITFGGLSRFFYYQRVPQYSRCSYIVVIPKFDAACAWINTMRNADLTTHQWKRLKVY